MKLKLLLILLIISLEALGSENIKFFSVSDMFRISKHEFFSLCKDDNGFVWASSRSEILRLTNDDYRSYRLPYELKDNIFIEIESNGTEIVAYTNNKQIFRYNEVLDRFDLIRLPTDLDLWISEILIGKDNSYWIATRSGLYRFKDDKLVLMGEASDVPMIAWGERGRLIFACNNEISMLDVNTLEVEHLCNFPLNTFLVSEIYYDVVMRRIMIGTLVGAVFAYDFNTKNLSRIDIKDQPLQQILAIESNTDSTLLVGFDGKGIYMLDKHSGNVIIKFEENVDDPYSLMGNGIYDILYDRETNIVWVCTYTGGVSFFKQSKSPVMLIQHRINNHNSLYNNHINQILEDSQGNLWCATDNGLSHLDTKNKKWTTYHQDEKQQSKVFLSLYEDDDGRIWAGTFSSGVYLIDAKTGREIMHYRRATTPLASDFAFDIFKDSEGNIWIGGNQNDIIVYSKRKKTFRSYGFQAVSAFGELDSAKIVMACANGLLTIDKISGQVDTLVANQVVHDLLVYRNDIWMCTNGEGLLRYNVKDKTLMKITEQSGLNSDYVYSILLSDGFLWVGTEQGLCRVNPEDNTVVNYSSLLSLGNIMFNRNANCRLRDGRLAFGTGNGVIMFNPSEVGQSSFEGRIFFQDILVNGRSIRDLHHVILNTSLDKLTDLSLKYNQNNLAVEILPISSESDYFRFSWKMEGQDENWSQISGLRKLNYTNIPAGDYKLQIRMYDNSMMQIAERSIRIRITPPFWDAWWFRTIFLFVVLAIAFISLRYYINRLKQKHTEEKVRFFANMAHDIRTSMTLITAPVGKMNSKNNFSDTDRYYLDLVKQQVQRLSMTATHLLDFQKTDVGKGQPSFAMTDFTRLITNSIKVFESLAKNKDIELEFVNLSPDYVSAIDAAMIEKVIDNLISNAIKYSLQDGKVTVVFEGNDKKWTLTVKDRGIGISKKARRKLFKEFYRGENAVNSKIIGSGLGLLLAKNYVAMHGGRIECESRENEGSEFKITVPYKKAGICSRTSSIDDAPSSIIPEQIPAPLGKLKMSILIAEDNTHLSNFMYHALAEEFDVTLADDGVQAWDMILAKTPDLVVSDILMPNRDGFELCRMLKSTFETSHIPLILLTSLTEKAQQLQGLGLGADDYLTKPFDMDLLAEKIKTIVRNRKSVRGRALKLINAEPDDRFFENELNDKFIKKAVEVVRRNIDNPKFCKDDFASAMNVSSSLLYKKIKSFTDQSVVEFINGIRLNYALELLQSRKYTIMEVGDMCGFSSLKYFSASFKDYFEKKPSDI
ncbi:sensor histidine kinase [Alphaproteobacteria bacterium]|nr:sensor histidine kinase [Alphaproteobacteria bacterium]